MLNDNLSKITDENLDLLEDDHHEEIEKHEDEHQNFATYLSACIKDVHTQNNASFRSFDKRLESVKETKSGKEFAEKIEALEDPADRHSILRSVCGFKAITGIKTSEQLYQYCEVLGINESDLEYVFNDPKERFDSVAKLSLVMAFGVWSKTMHHRAENGESVSQENLKVADKIREKLSREPNAVEAKSESYEAGVNFAKRILSGVKVERRRGRRPRNYFDQYNGK